MDITAVVERLRTSLTCCETRILQSTLQLAVEISEEGSEGARVGTLFTIGRPHDVLARSRSLILDPLAGHVPQATHILDPQARGTLKALAQLDGAFVMAEDGTVVAGCQDLDVSSAGVEMQLGLGSRHLAGASISKDLGIVAIVVSAAGPVRVFCRGELVVELRSGARDLAGRLDGVITARPRSDSTEGA